MGMFKFTNEEMKTLWGIFTPLFFVKYFSGTQTVNDSNLWSFVLTTFYFLFFVIPVSICLYNNRSIQGSSWGILKAKSDLCFQVLSRHWQDITQYCISSECKYPFSADHVSKDHFFYSISEWVHMWSVSFSSHLSLLFVPPHPSWFSLFSAFVDDTQQCITWKWINAGLYGH